MIPIYSEQLQYWLDISDAADESGYENTAGVLTWTPSATLSEYKPAFLERAISPTFKRTSGYTIDSQFAAMSDEPTHEYFIAHEDMTNVVTNVVRVDMFDPVTGGYRARRAAFYMTVAPLTQNANEPFKIPPTFNMTDDGWTHGVFNVDTRTFTPDSEEETVTENAGE